MNLRRRKPIRKKELQFIQVLDDLIRISDISRVSSYDNGTDYSNQYKYMISIYLTSGNSLNFRYYQSEKRNDAFIEIKKLVN